MSFAKAVQDTPEIAACLQAGLQSLGANSQKVTIKSPRDLAGSVNIDVCVAALYPNDHRWDYLFGYKAHFYYVEVHPGTTGEVKIVIAKLHWLKQWHRHSAPSLEDCQDQSTYHWIASGKVAITKNSKYSRQLAQNGIVGPHSRLQVDRFV